MITIDYTSLGIGAGAMLVLLVILWRLMPKHKVDISHLKKLVYETGIHINEAYKGIKELETFFKDVEKIKQ